MKRDHQRRKTIPAEPPKADPESRPGVNADSSAGACAGKKWHFRLTAMVLVPLLLLGGLELGLRLTGFGYPTGFFLRRQTAGRDLLIENARFGWRFFPKPLARAPEALAIPADKPKESYRIFILGESAALGDPEPAFGFGRILRVLLEERYSNTQFEIVNVAMTAINSHVILPIARDCARANGDLWVVYMGNNEVVGPFGAGTVFGRQAPGLALIRAQVALKQTRVGQLLDEARARISRYPLAPQSWGGMEMLIRQQVRRDDPRMERVYTHFQRNLSDILAVARRSGVSVVLCTVAANLKDCAPFASLHGPDLSAAKTAAWDGFFERAIAAEAKGKFAEALDDYLRAAGLDDRHAELQFRVGRCHWALGNFERARRSYELARDLDTLRFRADSRINEIIRAAGANKESAGVYLVDASGGLARQCPHQVPGEELFYEHVHLNFDGNYWLARSVAEQIANILDRTMPRGHGRGEDWAAAAHCAARLARTDWNQFQVLDEVRRRVQAPPFANQLDRPEREQRLQLRLAALKPAAEGPALGSATQMYRQALAAAPQDWVLHENFAKFLAASGDVAGAIQEWRRVVELIPHCARAYYEAANLLDAQGQSAEAQAWFLQALQAQPDLVEAMNGLGLALANQGKFAEAIRSYGQALRLKPNFWECRVNLGQALANHGQTNEATKEYLAVLRLDPKITAAHINLGRLLSDQGKHAEAARHYREAIRLRPDHAVAHFNLANALAAQNLRSEALAHYAEAVRLKPGFAPARYRLGLEFARLGKINEAQEQFLEVIKLKPDDAEAHLNLGVTFAQQKRINESLRHFQEALRLDPANRQAHQYLQAARAISTQNR